MLFQNILSFISASFCKMCWNWMIVYMLDYSFLVRIPCQLLPGTKYWHNYVFFSFYVVKMTIFDCKYIQKGVKRGNQNKTLCINMICFLQKMYPQIQSRSIPFVILLQKFSNFDFFLLVRIFKNLRIKK
jgi:hypothetical protein